jgi:hypothetical protein
MVTVRATPDKSCSNVPYVERTFEVVAPQVTFEKKCSFHDKDVYNLGMKLFIGLMPDDVSFKNITIYEEEISGIGQGAFSLWNGVLHGATPNWLIPVQTSAFIVKKGLGTYMAAVDRAYGNFTYNPTILTAVPMVYTAGQAGVLKFSIPYRYAKKGNSGANTLALPKPITQLHSITIPIVEPPLLLNTFLAIKKGNATLQIKLEEDTTLECDNSLIIPFKKKY